MFKCHKLHSLALLININGNIFNNIRVLGRKKSIHVVKFGSMYIPVKQICLSYNIVLNTFKKAWYSQSITFARLVC